MVFHIHTLNISRGRHTILWLAKHAFKGLLDTTQRRLFSPAARHRID